MNAQRSPVSRSLSSSPCPFLPAVFLDRDGVINELVRRDGRLVSPNKVEDFRLKPSVAEFAEFVRSLEARLFVVTNQPDIARGKMAWEDLTAMHEILQPVVQADDILICPHDDPDQCGCRKPQAGLLLQAATKYRLDLAASVLIGDSWRDEQAARRAGCRFLYVANGSRERMAMIETPKEAWCHSLDEVQHRIREWTTREAWNE